MKQPYFLDVKAGDYHAAAAAGRYLSSHNLARFRACPYTYHLLMTGGMKPPDSTALAFGRAVHCFTLESPDVFREEFTVTDGPVNPRTGEPFGKSSQKYRDFLAEQTREVVSTKDFEVVERMAESVWSHPEAKRLLADGESECTIRVEDFCGTPVQARLDWFSPDYGIADLKTTGDDLMWFESDARRFGYAHQLALYRRALEIVSGVKYPAYIIAVEKNQPHRVCVYKYSDDVLDQAEAENEKAIAELLECRAKDEWKTRYQETRLISSL